MEGHGGPAAWYFAYLLYYPVVILGAFFPWSCFLLPTILEARRRARANDPWRLGQIFVACWLLVWIGAFSIARTKLPSYITPVYPGLALLVAVGVVRWRHGRSQLREVWFRWSFATLAIAGGLLCIALPIVAYVLFRGAEWVGVLGLVPLVGGGLAWREFQRGNRAGALTSFAIAGSLLTLLSLSGLLPYVFNRHQRGPELLAEAARNVRTGGKEPTVLAFGSIEPSFVFNVRHPIPYFNHLQTNELFAAASADDTFIISRHKDAEWLHGKLPPGFVALHRVPYFARPGLDLVLMGRPKLDSRTNAPAAR
jgi:4-amino-4-deoxy-L-arabinose transferase-like glycosyltransferase